MKVSNVSARTTLKHTTSASQGDRSPRAAATGGIRITDGGATEVYPVRIVNIIGGQVIDLNNAEVDIRLRGVGTGLSNESGATLAYGAVVVVDTDGTITTTTTAQDIRPVGIVQRSTSDTFAAPVLFAGFVAQVNTTGTVNSGDFLETSTSAGLARASATRRVGSFAQALGDGPNPSALMWSPPDPVTNSGGGDAVTFMGARAWNNGAQTLLSSDETTLDFDSTEYDTDGIHNNDTMMTAPVDAVYRLSYGIYVQGSSGNSYAYLLKNSTDPIVGSEVDWNLTATTSKERVVTVFLDAGDFIEVQAYRTTGGDIGFTTAGASSYFEMIREPGSAT